MVGRYYIDRKSLDHLTLMNSIKLSVLLNVEAILRAKWIILCTITLIKLNCLNCYLVLAMKPDSVYLVAVLKCLLISVANSLPIKFCVVPF